VREHSVSSIAVVPKLVRAISYIQVAIMSYYPLCFAVRDHIEQHCGFGSALSPEESHSTKES